MIQLPITLPFSVEIRKKEVEKKKKKKKKKCTARESNPGRKNGNLA